MKVTGISPGIGIGNAHIVNRAGIVTGMKKINDCEKEISDLNRAISAFKEDLRILHEKTVQQAGNDAGMIFLAHQAIIEDPELMDRVKNKIRVEMVGAAYALKEVSFEFVRMFDAMSNEYLKERAADIKEVTDRVICFLEGEQESVFENIPENSILLAGELTTRDTVMIDREKVKGIAVETGGTTSHVAILARSLQIPAVVAEGIASAAKTGDRIVIDGGDGKVLLNPSKEIEIAYLKKLDDYNAEKERRKYSGRLTSEATRKSLT